MKQENSIEKVSNSSELLFYTLINVLAYSKFLKEIENPKEKIDSSNKDTIEITEFYQNFVKNEAKFSKKFDKKLYENIILIVDEFCAEKIREFLNIIENKHLNDSNKAEEFCDNNDKNIKFICFLYKKEIHDKLKDHEISFSEKLNLIHKLENKIDFYDYTEILFKELQDKNPPKLKELIDFEISRKELKESDIKLKLILECNQPSSNSSTKIVHSSVKKVQDNQMPQCSIS